MLKSSKNWNNPFGDGNSAEEIIKILGDYYG
jgi:UDP-N-acetylglucosamine 2-epimerase